MLTRDIAQKKLDEYISNPNLKKHCLAVEACMAYYANLLELGEEDKEKWALTGLIHDLDWEKYPNLHPRKAVEWLESIQADADIINAVAAHGFEFGVAPRTLMAKVLRAVDELSGFIVAVALVKGRSLEAVSVKSVKKKLKDKSFARGVNRDDIYKGVEELAQEINIDFDLHIENVIKALQGISSTLGL